MKNQLKAKIIVNGILDYFEGVKDVLIWAIANNLISSDRAIELAKEFCASYAGEIADIKIVR